MSLKSQLLQFLSQMPITQTVRDRRALLAYVEFERFENKITWEGNNTVFFNELLELLRSEGQSNLVLFLTNLRNSEWIGLDDRNKLAKFADDIQALTKEEWKKKFWGYADSQSLSRVPFVLPQLDESTFTGREEELKQLEEQLFNRFGSHVCSIVGLSGGSGIGKSALACHFATIHKDRFPDGIIGLRVDGKSPDQIARQFVNECLKFSREKFDLEDEQDAATLMQETFAHRRMLLIFDNAVDASLKQLRPGGNLCSVIITTRNRNLSASLDISVEGTIDLDPLPEEKAYQLLERILGTERVKAELEASYEIVRLVGCLPLALQITGKRLRNKSQSLADYLASLQQEKTRLSRLKVWGDDDLNVTVSLNLSLKELSQEQRDFFACLSVCSEDGFARRTATAVGECQDEWDAQDYLQVLYDLSLLNFAQTGENRFVFHPLVRVYAGNLAENNLLTIAQERHAKFFIEWLQSNELENTEIIPQVAENLDDVILAAQWLQNQNQESLTEQDKKERYEFILKLQPLFEANGYYEKAIKLMKTFQSWAEESEDWNAVVKYQMHEARYFSFAGEIKKAEEILIYAKTNVCKIEGMGTRKRREAKLLNVLGGIYKKQDKEEEAIQSFRNEIIIEEEIGDDKALAISSSRLGKLLQSKDKLEEARKVFERGIEVAEIIQDKFTIIIGLNCLGGLLQQQEKLAEAQQVFEREIAIVEEINDHSGLSITLNRLGVLLQQQGKLTEAQQIFERQILISEEIDDQSQLSIGLNRLGGLLQKQGKLAEAQQAFERQIAISEEIDDQSQLSIGLNCLGGLLQQQGKLAEAQQVFERQIAIQEKINEKSQLVITLNRLGGLLQQQGKLAEAQQIFERQILISEEIDDQSQLSIGLNRLGGLLQQQGKLAEVQQVFERQILISEEIDDQSQLSIGLNRLGGLLQKQGKLAEAQQAFERQILISEGIDDQSHLSIGLNCLGGLLQKQGKLAEAQQAFERQILISEGIDDQSHLSIGLNCLGGLLQQQGKLAEAQQAFERQILISEHLKEYQRLALCLHSLGRVLKSQNKLEKAEEVLKRSQQIFEDEKDLPNLAKVLNTLGGVLEKQQKWDEAEKILRQAYDLAVKLEDKRGQAIIANSLGQAIANQEGKEKFQLAQMYFRQSIKLGVKLNDQSHLAKVYTAMGQVFSANGNFEQAVNKFSEGFAIDETLANIRGLKIVTPNLTYALTHLGRQQEALDYCDRCLKIAPNNSEFLQLKKKIKVATSRKILLKMK